MDFFKETGTIAIGSRLRILSERMMDDAKKVYDFYEVGLRPKWFPVFYVLSQEGEKSVTEIAQEIGHSHPSVSKIVREMSKAGLVKEQKDKNDGRKNNILLTAKGEGMAVKIRNQYIDVKNAVDEALSHAKHNLWNALEEFEFLLDEQSMYERVMVQRKKREADKIEVIPYNDAYQKAFKELNEAWISYYFKMEDEDRKALNDPKGYILDKGGYIAVALYEGVPVGVCALIKMKDPQFDYELAKMAVAPEAKGKGIGWLLGEDVIQKSRDLGAKKIYLESNTMLTPAINLYHKLGFKRVVGNPSPYDRCNIKMELVL